MTEPFTPLESGDADIFDRIISDGMVPLFGSSDLDDLKRVTEAVVEAGLSTFEITLRSPGALQSFAELAAWADTVGLPLELGVGTVLDAVVAEAAVSAGARFVFSPVVSAEIGQRCQEHDIPYFPGCATPTEIHQALELGCEVVKIFPAATVGGPSFLRHVRTVFPSLLAIPTGGVVLESAELEEWFRAGACALGLGGALFGAGVVAAGEWDDVRMRLTTAVAVVAEAREASRR